MSTRRHTKREEAEKRYAHRHKVPAYLRHKMETSVPKEISDSVHTENLDTKPSTNQYTKH